ncbi:MAG: AMP-binding protein [Myxococcota bacterium]|nr:AMP-binding protein [Myxococcota bacterium]
MTPPVSLAYPPPVASTVHNVGDWPARWARTAPDRLAVVDGEQRIDYESFEDRVARTAGWLLARGVEPGDRVALLLANRASYLELVLATARIGAISVPMNTRLTAHEVAFQLDDAMPRMVVHETELSARVTAALNRSKHPPSAIIPLDDSERFDARRFACAPAPSLPVDPEDPMMILYTSGTTGASKGAVLPHRKTLYNALNATLYFGIRSGEERVLVAAPLFHSLGLKILSLPVLYAGGTLVLHRRFEAERVWGDIERERITYTGGVPTQYARLLERLESSADAQRDRSSLRFLFTAGAAISADTVRAYQGHGLVLKQGYGQTETSILCCLSERDSIARAGSVGRPVFHADIRLIDPNSFAGRREEWHDVGPGETGEIVVRGPIAMLGYWQKPEETASTFSGGWLRTGDLATRDEEGFITLSGRAHDMYISGGENVYPAEVEAALSQHPSIREVAVVGVANERWGESGRAHVGLAAGVQLDGEARREWASDRLAGFKLPSELAVESELPRTASGKVQKHRLSAG